MDVGTSMCAHMTPDLESAHLRCKIINGLKWTAVTVLAISVITGVALAAIGLTAAVYVALPFALLSIAAVILFAKLEFGAKADIDKINFDPINIDDEFPMVSSLEEAYEGLKEGYLPYRIQQSASLVFGVVYWEKTGDTMHKNHMTNPIRSVVRDYIRRYI